MRSLPAAATILLLACTTAAGRDFTTMSSEGQYPAWSLGPPAIAVMMGIAVDGTETLYYVGGNFGGAWKIDLRTNQKSWGPCSRVYTGQIDGEGGNPMDDLGDGNPAQSTLCSLKSALDILLDSRGNIFIADTGNSRVRRIDAVTGIIDTVAGNGTSGSAGDGGPATAASIVPVAVAVGDDGTLFISDAAGHRVRRVDPATGRITTYAGSGIPGFAGDGGAAPDARLNTPGSLALDPTGNLYISDRLNRRIRRVDRLTGAITTAVGDGSPLWTGECTPALSTGIVAPGGLAVDSRGNLYYSDHEGHRIRRVDAATSIVTTVAGSGIQTFSLDGRGGDKSDDLGDHKRSLMATLNFPLDLELESDGILHVADTMNERGRRIDLRADTTAFDPVLIAEPDSLTPVDDRLVDVDIATASGACGAGPALLVSVQSSDPDGFAGTVRGDVQDAEPGSPDDHIQLRAERSRSASGRSYTLTYEFPSPSGGFVLKAITVSVPPRQAGAARQPERRESTPRVEGDSPPASP